VIYTALNMLMTANQVETVAPAPAGPDGEKAAANA
jgi:hypothetical protein